MNKNYWLVKSEPAVYSWDKFVAQKQAVWDGVRNYQARNNLRLMRKGDWVLFYHSNQGQCVVGLAQVSQEHYPDPTTTDARWSAVSLVPLERFARAVSLSQIKQDPALANIALVKQSRLSVMPLDPQSFARILTLAQSQNNI